VDIFLAYGEEAARITFFGNEVDEIEIFDPISGGTIEFKEEIPIYPANIFSTTRERTISAIKQIQDDLKKQYDYFMEIGKAHEANRLKQRVEYDLEMIKELGYCPGIENYSRYFDGRSAGTSPCNERRRPFQKTDFD
jgi:excinuclease ABC subunit B